MTPDEPLNIGAGRHRCTAAPSISRISRQRRGQDLLENKVPKNSKSKEMKMLMSRGGRGGRKYDGSSKWVYFPKEGKISYHGRKER